MTTREELDQLYQQMWRAARRERLGLVRLLLERYIPFSSRRFSFAEVDMSAPGSLIYRSSTIKLDISLDLERMEGFGSFKFFYSRPSATNDIDQENWCRTWIVSNPERNPYLHYFLERMPIEITKPNPELPVKTAFGARRAEEESLKELRDFEPALAAAFEAFSWDYYGERFFRLFDPGNQSERNALAQYLQEYYQANYPPDALKRMAEGFSPPWKLCL